METQSATNSLYGVYAQESLTPTDRLLVDLSLRYDRSRFDSDTDQTTAYDYASGTYVRGAGRFKTDRTFNLFSPRIGVSYALTPVLNLFGTIARSDQVPSENEIT